MIFKLNVLDKNIFYISIEEYLNTHEYENVWEEVRFLSYDRKMTRPGEEDHSSAKNKEGKSLAQRRTVFLADVYKNNIFSNYLHVHKNFLKQIPKKLQDYLKDNILFQYFSYCEKSNTLLNYYHQDDSEYEAHQDRSMFTQIYWLSKDAKNYTGGELVLPQYNNHVIEAKDNKMILFPSVITHKVNKITFNTKVDEYMSPGKMNDKGRYSLVTFYKF